ncbi:hypothetical protein J6590_049145 [Homalodisca vitripennis]|nr:hypothetical protein J6590_049145 [Homalodisca vitripennis]
MEVMPQLAMHVSWSVGEHTINQQWDRRAGAGRGYIDEGIQDMQRNSFPGLFGYFLGFLESMRALRDHD